MDHDTNNNENNNLEDNKKNATQDDIKEDTKEDAIVVYNEVTEVFRLVLETYQAYEKERAFILWPLEGNINKTKKEKKQEESRRGY